MPMQKLMANVRSTLDKERNLVSVSVKLPGHDPYEIATVVPAIVDSNEKMNRFVTVIADFIADSLEELAEELGHDRIKVGRPTPPREATEGE